MHAAYNDFAALPSLEHLSQGTSPLPRPKTYPAGETFLENGLGSIISVQKKQNIYCQGDLANAVFYIQEGKVRLTVCSKSGREATIALLEPGDFIGEESALPSDALHMTTAVALTLCTLVKIERDDIPRALRRNKPFSDRFIDFLVARNVRIQQDLVDQLFNCSEKRLARALLLLAQASHGSTRQMDAPRVSQETLAAMVGTTRSRVCYFMNRFRKLGYIDYKTGHLASLRVDRSLIKVVLSD